METPEWLNTARIDIKNRGEGNDVKIRILEGDKCNVIPAAWFSKGGAGYVLMSEDRHLLLELECVGAGNLLVRLQGINKVTPQKERIPLWIDYTRLEVNKETVFWEIKPQWHDNPYKYTRKVADGEKIKVEISWTDHKYNGEELTKLLTQIYDAAIKSDMLLDLKQLKYYAKDKEQEKSRNNKRILYSFYHGASFGWVLIHRLLLHSQDEAYLLMPNDLIVSPGSSRYRKTVEKFLKKGIFQGIYNYHILWGFDGKTVEETEKNIEEGIDNDLRRQGCVLDSFDEIYSSTDTKDTLGIYMDMKGIPFYWFEFAPDTLTQRNEKSIKTFFASNEGYRETMLKHGTIMGKGKYQSYVMFPSSKPVNFAEEKMSYFDPHAAAVMLPKEVRKELLALFDIEDMPNHEHIAWVFLQSGYWASVLYKKVNKIQSKYANYKSYYHVGAQVMLDYFLPPNVNPVIKPHPSDIIKGQNQNKYFEGLSTYSSLFTVPLMHILPKNRMPEYAIILGSTAPKQLGDEVKKISCESTIFFADFYNKFYVVLEILNLLGGLYQKVGERFSVIDSKEFPFVNYSKSLLSKDIDTLVSLNFTDVQKECPADMKYTVNHNEQENIIADVMSDSFVIYTDVWETMTKEKLEKISEEINVSIIKMAKKPLKPMGNMLVPMKNEYVYVFSKKKSIIEKLTTFYLSRINKYMGIELRCNFINFKDFLQ